ncbi:hypothetical protein CB1_000473023 [Camelus ferus]|nr:hypothetical protein CB1_000473023 [Camelus ferus]
MTSRVLSCFAVPRFRYRPSGFRPILETQLVTCGLVRFAFLTCLFVASRETSCFLLIPDILIHVTFTASYNLNWLPLMVYREVTVKFCLQRQSCRQSTVEADGSTGKEPILGTVSKRN